MSIFHVQITEFTGQEPDNGVERLSIRVDDDPSKTIMRLLSTETRGPRKGSKKPATEGASK